MFTNYFVDFQITVHQDFIFLIYLSLKNYNTNHFFFSTYFKIYEDVFMSFYLKAHKCFCNNNRQFLFHLLNNLKSIMFYYFSSTSMSNRLIQH